MTMEVLPLTNWIGAEIRGLDLSAPLSDDMIATIRKVWLEHVVLLFRNQKLTPDQHVKFSARFGELSNNDNLYHHRIQEHPQILRITNKTIDGKPSDTRNTGRQWHSDLSYTLTPAVGSFLHAREIPPVGGDTMFANMYLAYETLSPKLQTILDGLESVHDYVYSVRLKKRDPQKLAEMSRMMPAVAQPVVRIHPETGRKALYVNETSSSHFIGMSAAESRGLLSFLFEHATRADRIYRHQWQLNDLLVWDNRCVQHIALADFDPALPREMYRTTIVGQECGRISPEPPKYAQTPM